MNRRHLGTALLVLGVVVLVAVPLLLHAGSSEFGGTDGRATELIEESGYTPWFAPVFSAGSTEVESGLFALQAAAGAGVLGYVLGRLRNRRALREALAAARTATAAGTATATRTDAPAQGDAAARPDTPETPRP
ncbi:energy-coupling factor ABC transporter substrate-binding protein [Geodermatophilus sp. SYSU D00079]